jgi:hypothetical protein
MGVFREIAPDGMVWGYKASRMRSSRTVWSSIMPIAVFLTVVETIT